MEQQPPRALSLVDMALGSDATSMQSAINGQHRRTKGMPIPLNIYIEPVRAAHGCMPQRIKYVMEQYPLVPSWLRHMHGIIDTYLEPNSRHDHAPCPSPPDALPRCCAVLAAGAKLIPQCGRLTDALHYQQEIEVLYMLVEAQHWPVQIPRNRVTSYDTLAASSDSSDSQRGSAMQHRHHQSFPTLAAMQMPCTFSPCMSLMVHKAHTSWTWVACFVVRLECGRHLIPPRQGRPALQRPFGEGGAP